MVKCREKTYKGTNFYNSLLASAMLFFWKPVLFISKFPSPEMTNQGGELFKILKTTLIIFYELIFIYRLFVFITSYYFRTREFNLTN
jgi:hypothetical protein